TWRDGSRRPIWSSGTLGMPSHTAEMDASRTVRSLYAEADRPLVTAGSRCGPPLASVQEGSGVIGLHMGVVDQSYTGAMFSFLNPAKSRMPERGSALAGRPNPIPTAERHFVNGAALKPPYPPA